MATTSTTSAMIIAKPPSSRARVAAEARGRGASELGSSQVHGSFTASELVSAGVSLSTTESLKGAIP